MNLKKYTEEQFDALDAMSLNPRVIFRGPAGTGKTLLALEAARRFSVSGEKTLLLCFNRLLGTWFKNETMNMPNLTAGTLHSHMLSVSGGKPPDTPTPAFWEKELPLLAIEKLVENDASNQFDRLILDESQDFLLPAYLDFSLTGGLSSGKWIFFGDLRKCKNQNAPIKGIETCLRCRDAVHQGTQRVRSGYKPPSSVEELLENLL